MISRISKMLVMMALPIMLLACGGPSGTGGTKASGMRFVVAPGQTLPAGVTAEEGRLGFGEVNFAGVEKGPIKYNLTNVTGDSVTFLTTGLVGGSGDIFITASSCFETLAADDSCEVTVTLSPKEKDRSYKDEYSVEFYFGTDQTIISEPVMLELSARTFAGDVEGVDGVTGLNVSQNYQSVEFDNVSLGNTSSPQVVQYFYFGDDEIIITPTESVTASATTATTDTDREISVESACGLLRYGDSCSVQLFYKPAVPSAELGDDKYSHLPVSVIQTGDPVVTSTIKMVKESFKPADSLLIEFQDNITSEKLPELTITDQPAPGAISVVQNLKLARTADSADITQVFYRLESTNPAIQVTRKNCDLVLEKGKTESCELDISFSSEDAGAKVGYVMAVAGQERIFLKVSAEATAGTPEPIGSDMATVLDTKTVELQADISALSTTKRIKVSHTGNTDGKPFSISLGGLGATSFQYTTTCVDNKALTKANPVCYVDINFRGDATAGADKIAALTFTSADASTVAMDLTGNTVTSVPTSAATPVKGLTIDTKSFAYPTTGIGLVSPTFLINLENTNPTAISGLGTTSTDLATFTLNNTLDTACKSTLGTGTGNNTCTLGYVFRPRNSLEKTGYISIFDNTTDADLRNNEIIQVVGRGTLFNEYLSFGVVAPLETKTLIAALTNDGKAAIEISSVDLTEFRTVRRDLAAGQDNFTTTAGKGAAARVALSTGFFRQDNFTTAPVASGDATIKLLSNECAGTTLEPGASCLLRLSFTPDALDTGTVENNHYRAYVNFKGADNKNVDKLHVIGSSIDNSTMYMYPLVDINEDVVTPATKYEDNSSTAWVSWDTQFSVIGKTAYAYTGRRPSGNDEWHGDKYLRKFDSARNSWVILDPANNNESPLNSAPDAANGAVQGKMVSHDGKLYFNALRNSVNYYGLHSYDPNFGTDGKWSKLKDGPHEFVNVAMAAFKGKIYIYGGRKDSGGSQDVAIYDIAESAWIAPTVTGTKPSVRMSSAIAVVEINRVIGTDNLSIPYMIMHGGSGGNAGLSETFSDLWALELPYYDKDGKEQVRPDNTWTWTQLQADSPHIPGDAADEAQAEIRPTPRSKHVFDYYNGQLVLTANGVNEGTSGPFVGGESNYFILDPAKLFADGNTTCTADSEECNAFTFLKTLDKDYLGIHASAVLSGDLWFHNWNILGVFFAAKETTPAE